MFLPEKNRFLLLRDMKKIPLRNWITPLIVLVAACVFITVTGWLLANPSQEITQAVSANGKKNVKAADADSFLDAYSSVLETADEDQTPDYVAAAKKLRPDLSEQIDETTAEVESAPEDTNSTDRNRVSGHNQRVAVCCHHNGADHTVYIPRKGVDEFLSKHPNCHRGRCRPDNQRVAVCCHHNGADHTVYIPRKGVAEFLSKHPDCHRGACSGT